MASTADRSRLLFKDRVRTDPSYAGDEEPTWTFLERVDDEGFPRLRLCVRRGGCGSGLEARHLARWEQRTGSRLYRNRERGWFKRDKVYRVP